MNILAFPYAGGDSYCYRKIREQLPPTLNFRTLELPGRGRRSREPLKTDLLSMANDARAFVGAPPSPYLLFGHSMGAALAFETARRLRDEKVTPPIQLVVSGRAAPRFPSHRRRSDLPAAEFRGALRELGACPEEILNDPELMGYFEPVLRADFHAIEHYRSATSDRLDVGITVLVGDGDDVTDEEAEAWQERTSRKIEILRFSGDHFFLLRHARDIARMFVGIFEFPPTRCEMESRPPAL